MPTLFKEGPMRSFFSVLLFILFAAACGDGREETSGLDYATFTPGREVMRQWSAFTTIEQRGCALPVELYTFSGVSVPPEQSAFVRRAVEKAVRAWTGALYSNPFWACGESRVAWGAGGPGAVEVYLDPTVSRAYTLVGQNQIYLSHASSVPGDPYAERVILHEFGHIFGLADTYSEPGYQQPIGQMPGIMNRLFDVPWLTSDDLAGAYALYEYINGRGAFCERGYTVGGAYENANRIAFCVPAFGPNPPPPQTSR
jgi:hypothetical protein